MFHTENYAMALALKISYVTFLNKCLRYFTNVMNITIYLEKC